MTSAVSDEMLLALADGELEKATADALHARVMAEPELAERFALFVESRALLEGAGSSDQAVPPHLLAAIRAGDGARPGRRGLAVIEGGATLAAPAPAVSPRSLPRRPGWQPPLAACIALLIGGIAGYRIGSETPGNPAPSGVALFQSARAALDTALGSSASGSSTSWPHGAAGGSITLVSSHRLGDGTLCREYTLASAAQGADRWKGIDCRVEGRWRTELVIATPSSGGGYRPASGDSAADAFLQDRNAESPLAPAAEAELLNALARPKR